MELYCRMIKGCILPPKIPSLYTFNRIGNDSYGSKLPVNEVDVSAVKPWHKGKTNHVQAASPLRISPALILSEHQKIIPRQAHCASRFLFTTSRVHHHGDETALEDDV